MLQKGHHVAVICSDEQKALEFYVNKLGFQVEKKVWVESMGEWIQMLRLEDVTIELFVRPDAPPRVTEPEALGLCHLCFRVAEVEQAIKWLNGMGIETGPIIPDPFGCGKLAFFWDPDGLPLEIHD